MNNLSSFLELFARVSEEPVPRDDLAKEAEEVSHDEQASVHPVPAPSTLTAKSIFRHPDAHPIVLDLLLLKKYGIDWFLWEPETVEHLLTEDGSPISEVNFAKIQACKTLHVADSYWRQWEVFLWCTMGLNGILPDFVVMQIPTLAQCLVSVDIARRIRQDVQWSTEMRAYLEVVYRFEDVHVPLVPLEFITPSQSDLAHIDISKVLSMWPSVKKSLKVPVGDTLEHSQLRKMLAAYEYLDASRTRLQSQLPLVNHV